MTSGQFRAQEGFEDLELSTQILIQDALAWGVEVEILARSTHTIRLKQGDRVEIVRQASKTRLDSYITAEILAQKQVCKQLLSEAGFRVPEGRLYTKVQDAMKDYAHWAKRACVIKPNETNYGTAVHMFENPPLSESQYQAAVEDCLLHDEALLVEDFVKGNEYRFLVMNGEVVGVMKRMAANVIGDGKSTIEALIQAKNKHPFRGIGHRTPLEVIEINQSLLDVLKETSLELQSIPPQGDRIKLRQVSNISMGGDTLDVTEAFAPFHALAVKVAAQLGAVFCGVDIIIDHADQAITGFEPYSVLEANFNPAFYFHNYPLEGKNRQAGHYILKALGFINKNQA